MPSTARCSTPPPAALLIVTLWLSCCAIGGSETGAPCPPVVEYTATDQARAADEVEALPEGAVVVRMLSDYAVMRDQARGCRLKHAGYPERALVVEFLGQEREWSKVSRQV